MSGERQVHQSREALTARLMGLFDRSARPDWTWFEEELTYDNAKLAHALVLSGHAAEQRDVLERGLAALRWLADVQTSEIGYLRPIGSNGFYRRGGARALFDQQPIEAQATVSACIEAYQATSDMFWVAEARRAFEWYLGRNDLGLALYDPGTGGCRDGLHMDRLSENQGAESTLAFLLALLGYGTKAGLAPMHTWKPDAYSEAPIPSAALRRAIFMAQWMQRCYGRIPLSLRT